MIKLKPLLEEIQNYPKSLNREMMSSFILSNNLSDWSGEIDFNDAKQISGASDEWVLTELPIESFGDIKLADPAFKNKSVNIPPIVLKFAGNEYEILDGKHRVGAAKARGDKTIQVYLGTV